MLYELIDDNLPSNYKAFCDFNNPKTKQYIDALERQWIRGNKGASTPFWAEEIGDKFRYNIAYALSKAGWVESIQRTKFNTVIVNQQNLDKYMTTNKQLKFRRRSKSKRMTMKCVEELQPSNLTKTPSGIRDTGLDRPGFAIAANNKFQLDTKYILKYYEALVLNLTRGIENSIKKYSNIADDNANYKEMSIDVLDYYLCNPDKYYNMERNINDQRGRSIYGGLVRLFNPVTSKDARAVMIPNKHKIIMEDDTKSLSDIYLFIAELTGSNAKSWTAKKLSGRIAYKRRTLPLEGITVDEIVSMPMGTKDEIRKQKHLLHEVHEQIWLERIYDKLDELFENGSVKWNVLLEKDQTASILQVIGTALNDKRLMDKTNLINANKIQDAWQVGDVPRRMTKAFMTPSMYGSSQSIKKLLLADSHKLVATKEQIKTIKSEYKSGGFSVAVGLKDFFITHSNPTTPTMIIDMYDEQFEIEVNKSKIVGANLKAYNGYSTQKDRKSIFMIHQPIRVPDYERFKLFYPTLFAHNRDSRNMDNAVYKFSMLGHWCLAIHDAVLVLPGTGFRKIFVEEMEIMRKNRINITDSYKASIGATTMAARIQWAKLNAKVEQLEPNVKIAESCLK